MKSEIKLIASFLFAFLILFSQSFVFAKSDADRCPLDISGTWSCNYDKKYSYEVSINFQQTGDQVHSFSLKRAVGNGIVHDESGEVFNDGWNGFPISSKYKFPFWGVPSDRQMWEWTAICKKFDSPNLARTALYIERVRCRKEVSPYERERCAGKPIEILRDWFFLNQETKELGISSLQYLFSIPNYWRSSYAMGNGLFGDHLRHGGSPGVVPWSSFDYRDEDIKCRRKASF